METNEDTELGQMKEQLALLKKKLRNESIVNDKLMRKIMSDKVSKINRDTMVGYILIFLAIPYWTWLSVDMLDFSWWFCGVTDMFFIVALIYTYISHKDIRAKELLEGNLLEVSYKITRMKKMEANWLKIGMPFLVIWLTWMVLEILHGRNGNSASILVGGAIGAVIGGIIGTWQYRKKQRRAEEIISQIKEQCKDD
ncbi:MAG: hypothetical protein LKH27_04185 [Prevotella sp.]|nr:MULTISPECIES: hypothetical protein [unclassified Prevotella]MCH3969110.1 hypothetical protein [Prevotella sp.]MCH3985194.1 hypothetical protein [Prevotella sp.]MCH3992040.1 hypothetical protein [Prevotella sp.]MCH4017387.1 hypothetical protein [Prevotella sp.]MCH4099643.1 hypothetical protein [Prevotella sp.]